MKISLFRRWRQAGWRYERNADFVMLSWGRPRVHSRFAFMLYIYFT